jgi:hypothetical protein
MAENTFVKIQTVTVTSSNGSAYIDFTNIPQNYGALVLKCSLRSTASGSNVSQLEDYTTLVVNFDASLIQSRGNLFGGGGGSGTAGYNYGANGTYGVDFADTPCALSLANAFTNATATILDYSSTSKYKTFQMDTGYEGVTGSTLSPDPINLVAGNYRSLAPVTSLRLALPYNGGLFATGSSATLYGISTGVKANGGTVNISGGYVYHTFTSSGIFTPVRPLTVDILQIAGGGGGGGCWQGNYPGGGGGAGGYLYFTSQSVTANSYYPVLVGAGGFAGQGSTNYGIHGSKGISSRFGTLTASIGGGGGETGGIGVSTRKNGGSGGGPNGTAVAGQGNVGGNNSGAASAQGGGGGGGAGAAGGNGSGSAGGAGGAGLNTLSTWATATGTGASGYYAGGGGGGSQTSGTAGAGGAGGGGAGAYAATAGSATANTGSGGGGTSQSNYGGNGGSGIVIVRYAL